MPLSTRNRTLSPDKLRGIVTGGVYMTNPCRVLMVYPKFVPNSFWNYTEALRANRAKYPAAPLGLTRSRHAAETLGHPSRQSTPSL